MRNYLFVSHIVASLIGAQLGYLLCLTRNNISSSINKRDKFDNLDEWVAEPEVSTSSLSHRKSDEQKHHHYDNAKINTNQSLELLGNRENNELKIPGGTKFCLIHVGKTAGRSLACELGEGETKGMIARDLLCYRYRPEPSALKRAFAGRSHVWGKGCESQRYSAFIYTLRNPLERLISWYYYENPNKNRDVRKRSCSNKFFKWANSTNACFSSLEDFAIHTIPPASTIQDDLYANKRSNCTEFAWNVATGEHKCYAHNSLGYAYYYRRMQQLEATMKDQYPMNKNKKMIMLAIRTEHLIHDWDTLDEAFSGKTNNIHSSFKKDGYKRFTNKPKSQEKSIKTFNETIIKNKLSHQGRLNLCNALCFEIQVYKTMLHMAINLNATHVRNSIQEVIDSCPEETFEIRTCPSPSYATTLYSIEKPFRDPIQCQCTVSPL